MGWFNFSKTGSASAQSDNAETMTNDESGDKSVPLTDDIQITDVVLDVTASETHQFRFYVNGKQQGGNFYATQINPASDGRISWADQGIVIGKGSSLQIRGSQQSGASAEALKVLVKYKVV